MSSSARRLTVSAWLGAASFALGGVAFIGCQALRRHEDPHVDPIVVRNALNDSLAPVPYPRRESDLQRYVAYPKCVDVLVSTDWSGGKSKRRSATNSTPRAAK